MKIQCDVCSKESASVFCPSDEAALCEGCDRRIHHANKLAGKHTRVSLLHQSSSSSPKCDICQDRRAFLFCQEDRAILCRECDSTIHKTNQHTQKHNRFLLTGVKISDHPSSSSSYSTILPPSEKEDQYFMETLPGSEGGSWAGWQFDEFNNPMQFLGEDNNNNNNNNSYYYQNQNQNQFFH